MIETAVSPPVIVLPSNKPLASPAEPIPSPASTIVFDRMTTLPSERMTMPAAAGRRMSLPSINGEA